MASSLLMPTANSERPARPAPAPRAGPRAAGVHRRRAEPAVGGRHHLRADLGRASSTFNHAALLAARRRRGEVEPRVFEHPGVGLLRALGRPLWCGACAGRGGQESALPSDDRPTRIGGYRRHAEPAAGQAGDVWRGGGPRRARPVGSDSIADRASLGAGQVAPGGGEPTLNCTSRRTAYGGDPVRGRRLRAS